MSREIMDWILAMLCASAVILTIIVLEQCSPVTVNFQIYHSPSIRKAGVWLELIYK